MDGFLLNLHHGNLLDFHIQEGKGTDPGAMSMNKLKTKRRSRNDMQGTTEPDVMTASKKLGKVKKRIK